MHALLLALALVVPSPSPAPLGTGPTDQATAPDVSEGPDRALRITGQAVVAPAVGLAAGFAAAYLGVGVGWGGNDTLGFVLLFGSPVAFALGEAFTVHGIGAAVDGPRQGSLAATLGGSLAGTAAGLAIFLSRGNGRSILDRGDGTTFVAGVAVATAATIVSYELSRPRDSKRKAPTVTVMPMLPAGRAPKGGAWGLQVGLGF